MGYLVDDVHRHGAVQTRRVQRAEIHAILRGYRPGRIWTRTDCKFALGLDHYQEQFRTFDTLVREFKLRSRAADSRARTYGHHYAAVQSRSVALADELSRRDR